MADEGTVAPSTGSDSVSFAPSVTTGTPTGTPSVAPSVTTGTPTGTPTDTPSVTTGTPTFSPSSNGTDVEIIRLPSYTSKDPVDGIFMAVLVIILLAICGACIHGIRKRNLLRVRDRTARDLETELAMNEEDGDREIRLKDHGRYDDEGS